MEYWDIYDEKKQKTGRTMKRNDWNMKPDEYHLTVQRGVYRRELREAESTREKIPGTQ